ncbi:glycosyltransferase [Candidatus Microgenomates bacterium]|nr:glycosyltransferase [Candidatus Microgenomates bacterium]
MQVKTLSVFFPAYNEEANIEKTVSDALKVLQGLNLEEFEVIVVNDGSKDDTAKIVKKLENADKHIRLVNHQVNKGYGEALKTGFKNAKYEWVAFADSDGQFNFSEIAKFLERSDEADFILGYRIKRADPLVRRIGNLIWTIMARFLVGLSARDYSCGFKLIKKEAFEKVLPLEAGEKVTQIEMLVKAKRVGFRFAEVGVHHYRRKFGTQTGADLKVVVKSYLDLVKFWWKIISKREFFILIAILAVAIFLRFWKLPEYMMFLGDEGRDAIVVRRLLVDFDPILIGPGTSIGNMYLGPLYYYLMAPAMFLSGLSPVGPAVLIAFLGVVTVWLVWRITREWFGNMAAQVAALLYAVSPIVITYSRSSWNPNIIPFFALISIYAIWRVWKNQEFKWLIVLGISYAFVLQSHYLGLLLLPTLGIFWLLTLYQLRTHNHELKNLLRYTLISLVIFAVLMSPLVIFDARHGWHNFSAMKEFFTNRQTTVSLKPWNAMGDIWPIWQDKFVGRFVAGMDVILTKFMAALLTAGLIWLLVWSRSHLRSTILLAVWLVVGLVGMALYKQNIYDHYFGFMFAAPFILLGAITQNLVSKRKLNILATSLIIVLLIVNLREAPIKNPPQRQLQRTAEIARKIAQESHGQPFNLAVLAERNYEDAYQYFLEWWQEPVREIDPLRYQETVADQLFVVCELPAQRCDPTHSSKAEVTVFGWSKIEKEWEIKGIVLYKLIHNPAGTPQ